MKRRLAVLLSTSMCLVFVACLPLQTAAGSSLVGEALNATAEGRTNQDGEFTLRLGACVLLIGRLTESAECPISQADFGVVVETGPEDTPQDIDGFWFQVEGYGEICVNDFDTEICWNGEICYDVGDVVLCRLPPILAFGATDGSGAFMLLIDDFVGVRGVLADGGSGSLAHQTLTVTPLGRTEPCIEPGDYSGFLVCVPGYENLIVADFGLWWFFPTIFDLGFLSLEHGTCESCPDCIDMPTWVMAESDSLVQLSQSHVVESGQVITGEVLLPDTVVQFDGVSLSLADLGLGVVTLTIETPEIAEFSSGGCALEWPVSPCQMSSDGGLRLDFSIVGVAPGEPCFAISWKTSVLGEGACSIAILAVYAGCKKAGTLTANCVCSALGRLKWPATWACAAFPHTFRAVWDSWDCQAKGFGPSPY